MSHELTKPTTEHQSDHVPSDHHPSSRHDDMIRNLRRKWLWTNATVVTLGLWLITCPATFGYTDSAMIWSDVISGALIVIFGTASFWPRCDFYGRWGACFVGTWLQFAPLVLWATSPAAYANDTLVGALVIALTVLVPMMPGMAHHMEMMKPGPEVPPGWSYNPSSWHQRAPLIATGFAGWFISRYLAAMQLGYIDKAWDPFFGEGTQRVLHSEVSRMWPISDAGLGALAYTIEALMAWMGGVTRWRTMPWMVTFFGILVVPLGITHIVLVILQPVVVGYWCTLCLAAALIMLVMIPLAVDEVVAMGQFLARSVREGKSFWRTFWVGGTLAEENKDTRSPHYGSPLRQSSAAMFWGVSFPWTLLASALLGLWLMVTPAVLGSVGGAAKTDQFIGALILTIAVIATAEVVRPLRWLNIPLGIWAALAPWLMSGAVTASRWSDLIAGILLIAFSFPRGSVREQYAGWNRFVR